jgi:hypothetical protein
VARFRLDHCRARHSRRAIGQARAQVGEGRRGGRVARHHEQLDVARQQQAGDLGGEAAKLLLGALAVGEAGGVAQVEEVLLGQPHQQLVQDGQASDARVEHADRARGGILRRT